jgi:hypothetical protein
VKEKPEVEASPLRSPRLGDLLDRWDNSGIPSAREYSRDTLPPAADSQRTAGCSPGSVEAVPLRPLGRRGLARDAQNPICSLRIRSLPLQEGCHGGHDGSAGPNHRLRAGGHHLPVTLRLFACGEVIELCPQVLVNAGLDHLHPQEGALYPCGAEVGVP